MRKKIEVEDIQKMTLEELDERLKNNEWWIMFHTKGIFFGLGFIFGLWFPRIIMYLF